MACDLIVQARASRRLSQQEIARLERLVFGGGGASRDGLEALLLIDTYIEAGDADWSNLLARAAAAFDLRNAEALLAQAA